MPLDDQYPGAVAFVVGLRKNDAGVVSPLPIGTAFIVSIPSKARPTHLYLYLVTAAHVVRNEPQTWVRFNTKVGGNRDIPVPEWFIDPTEDVAVVPFTPPDDIRWVHIPEGQFLNKVSETIPEAIPNLGDQVYFIGLLAGLTAMSDANVPMVRSGTLGRMYQPDVPITLPDKTVIHVTGHLIDCRSYGGFSGSPCFVQFEYHRMVDEPAISGGMIGNLLFEATALVGLIVAHFDQWSKARVTGDFFGQVEAPINTGVGVVTPVEALRATLYMEELENMRRTNEERAKSEEEADELTATADRAEEEHFTKRDFEDALRKVSRKVTPPEQRPEQGTH